MRLSILGLHSVIGRHLIHGLTQLGHRVSGTSRSENPLPAIAPRLEAYHSLQLGDPADPQWFQDCDAVIYLVHDHSRGAAERNINGIRSWYNTARNSGVPRHFFFTSYSAKPGSHSEYGAVKQELELFFLSENQWAVRPGLVMGHEGLFTRMVDMVRKMPLVPLLDGGWGPVPLVMAESMAPAMDRLLRGTSPGAWNLHRPDLINMKDLLTLIRRLSGSRCRFLPVPSILPLVALRLVEALGGHFSVSADSIAAMRDYRHIKRTSHLSELGVTEPDLETVIASRIGNPE